MFYCEQWGHLLQEQTVSLIDGIEDTLGQARF